MDSLCGGGRPWPAGFRGSVSMGSGKFACVFVGGEIFSRTVELDKMPW
jgi:hypothetical protein